MVDHGDFDDLSWFIVGTLMIDNGQWLSLLGIMVDNAYMLVSIIIGVSRTMLECTVMVRKWVSN